VKGYDGNKKKKKKTMTFYELKYVPLKIRFRAHKIISVVYGSNFVQK
jgi:hypothetical protein